MLKIFLLPSCVPNAPTTVHFLFFYLNPSKTFNKNSRVNQALFAQDWNEKLPVCWFRIWPENSEIKLYCRSIIQTKTLLSLR